MLSTGWIGLFSSLEAEQRPEWVCSGFKWLVGTLHITHSSASVVHSRPWLMKFFFALGATRDTLYANSCDLAHAIMMDWGWYLAICFVYLNVYSLSVIIFATCMMTSNNSEIPDLHGSPGAKQQPPATVRLWNSFPFGALICQVLLKHWAGLSVESFTTCHVQAARLPRLCSTLDALILSDVHSSLQSSGTPLSHVWTISSICLHTRTCIHTHTQMHEQVTSMRTLKSLSLDLSCQLWQRLMVYGSHFLLWHYQPRWHHTGCRLQNFYSDD